MASIFSKLFGNHASVIEENPVSDKAMFVDNETPVQGIPDKGSIIKQFLDQDHYAAGQAAGYQMHDMGNLNFLLKGLKSKFQHVCGRLQENLHDELEDKKQKMILLGDEPTSLKQRLELTIKEIENTIARIDVQKSLSVDGEGWMAPVLHDFEKGYRMSIEDYINENSFLTRRLI